MIGHVRRYLSVGAPHWAVRRRIVVGLTLFAVATIAWVVAREHDAVKARDTITAMVSLIQWVLMTYVGAATAEDVMGRLRGDAPAGAAGPPAAGARP